MHEDTKRYVASCPECQRTGNISQKNSMPLRYNLQIDLFDVWGIDFMGPFKNSHGYEHILVMVDYVSKWVEAMPCRKASTEESIAMIKSMIFPRFGTPRILISDGGSRFTENNFKKCLSKLGIEHRVSTAYHPQTNGQAETSNRQLKSILNKTIEKGGKDWSKKLDGALWTYRTTFKTPIGMTPYQFIYGKACHLPVELEHKSHWVIKEMNLDLNAAVVVNTKNWYRKETDLWAEFGKKTPIDRKFSSKHSVKMSAVGSTPSFGRRAVLRLEEEAFGNT
jgi:transposase InsO family protein